MPLSPNSEFAKLGGKQAHSTTHAPHLHGLTALVAAWLMAKESEINDTLYALVAQKRLSPFYHLLSTYYSD